MGIWSNFTDKLIGGSKEVPMSVLPDTEQKEQQKLGEKLAKYNAALEAGENPAKKNQGHFDDELFKKENTVSMNPEAKKTSTVSVSDGDQALPGMEAVLAAVLEREKGGFFANNLVVKGSNIPSNIPPSEKGNTGPKL